MKLEKDNVKRCGIFLYFDKQGKVDDYISYMLKDLKKSVDYLLVVCNGYIERQGLDKLRGCSDEVLCRANVGFDLGGYREGLFYIGWKQLEQYDELVMMNYTFFGPLYPFAEMFDTMAEKDVDFWGVTKHHRFDPDPFGTIPYGYLPEHIQSHLIVVRKSMFMSYQYRDFMMNRENPTNYNEAISTYEAIFTKIFSDFGFTWDVYLDSSDQEGVYFYPIMYAAKDAIEKRRSPIIKRRSFFTGYDDFLANSCGEVSVEAYEYLQKNELYDLNLIWDNILRLENLTAVHRCLHLDYMLESYATNYTWNQKIAVVVIADGSKNGFFYSQFLAYLPGCADIYLYGEQNDCRKIAEMCTSVQKVVIRECDTANYAEVLRTVAEDLAADSYDYVGIARLKDAGRSDAYVSDVSWQNSDWENLFGNENICGNLLQYFEENPRMGLCIPPVPCHGKLFAKTQGRWNGRFDDAKEYLTAKGITVNVSAEENPLAPYGGTFWIRGALLPLLRTYYKTEDEELVLLTLPEVIQHFGYYTGIGYSDKNVSAAVTNQDYMFRENNRELFKKFGVGSSTLVRLRVMLGDMSAGEEWMEKN